MMENNKNNSEYRIHAGIFDVDGTLLDSMSVWDDIGERYLLSQGITAGADINSVLGTMSMEQGAAYLKEEYHLDKTVPQIVKEVLKIVEDFYRFEAALKPGAKEALEWLSEKGMKMVIATSGNKELAEAALERNGVLGYFKRIYTCTEIGAGKDEPAIYLKAAEDFGMDPENIIVVEDAVHAAETAKKAGFVVLGVYDESSRENSSRMRDLCDFYYERMDQIIR